MVVRISAPKRVCRDRAAGRCAPLHYPATTGERPAVDRLLDAFRLRAVVLPSRIEGDRLYGRGACDAKGIIAAQVAAADKLRRAGETRVGLLFVVGEERGSDGARLANEAASGSSRFLIDGEPTDNRMGLATRGILRLKLRTNGRVAHSSFPELGESAIDKPIDAPGFRTIELPTDSVLGTTYTVGLIAGGSRPTWCRRRRKPR
jgi:acetylornithine deacetylase